MLFICCLLSMPPMPSNFNFNFFISLRYKLTKYSVVVVTLYGSMNAKDIMVYPIMAMTTRPTTRNSTAFITMDGYSTSTVGASTAIPFVAAITTAVTSFDALHLLFVKHAFHAIKF